VLQLKRGTLSPRHFSGKYGVSVLSRFAEPLMALKAEGFLAQADEDAVALSRQGLLRIDSLLPRFFLPEHTGIRYT